jgi:hypothetical protein
MFVKHPTPFFILFFPMILSRYPPGITENFVLIITRGKAHRGGHYQKRGSAWLCLNWAPYSGNAICPEALPTTFKPLVANASLSAYIIIYYMTHSCMIYNVIDFEEVSQLPSDELLID